MTADQLALLRNIRANPNDDLARLVYADWVEERGDPAMAELIRVHVERERAEPNSPRYFDLITHTAMLLAQHRDRWTAELSQRFGVTGAEFVRGIPEEVELPLGAFVTRAAELLASLPIRHVMLTGVGSLEDVRRLTVPANVMRSVAVDGVGHQAMGWRPGWTHTRERRTFTLLDPAPRALEQALRAGRWRILCPAVWSGPDRETETAFFRRFSGDPDGSTAFGELRLATRPFSEPAEFERWCPVPNPQAGPHWIELEGGRLVSHRRGLELPALGDEDDDPDVYDEDWE